MLTISGTIKANGGDTSSQHAESGGGGSGGTIRLEGGSVSISGTLEAKGGNGLTATQGGGGRIAIKTNGNLTLGTVSLDGYNSWHSSPVRSHPNQCNQLFQWYDYF